QQRQDLVSNACTFKPVVVVEDHGDMESFLDTTQRAGCLSEATNNLLKSWMSTFKTDFQKKSERLCITKETDQEISWHTSCYNSPLIGLTNLLEHKNIPVENLEFRLAKIAAMSGEDIPLADILAINNYYSLCPDFDCGPGYLREINLAFLQYYRNSLELKKLQKYAAAHPNALGSEIPKLLHQSFKADKYLFDLLLIHALYNHSNDAMVWIAAGTDHIHALRATIAHLGYRNVAHFGAPYSHTKKDFIVPVVELTEVFAKLAEIIN